MKYLTVALWTAVGIAAAPPTMGRITWSSGPATQVRIEIPPGIRVDDHQQPGKLILDLQGVRPDSRGSHTYTVNDGVVARIRVAGHPPSTVRVVLDLETNAKCRISRDSSGALIIQAPKGVKIASPRPAATLPAPTPTRPLRSSAAERKTPPTNIGAPIPHAPAPIQHTALVASVPRREASDRGSDIQIAPAMELTILEDTAQDVPFVLQRYSGAIGFAPAKAASIEKLFRAPDWSPAPVTSGRDRLSDYFALQFADEKSVTVEDLRRRYSLERSLAAYALFPHTFLDMVHAEIRQAAAKQSRTGQVTAATIMFTMLGSGVEIKSVTVRP
jgi:hypothetical protein